MRDTKLRGTALVAILLMVAVACGDGASGDGGGGEGPWTIGVSNTLVGNGWREQMICAIKAEASASGVIDEVVVVN
ncbi:MAG: sugar ABC transporter substrate-binding protein, partial [Acidimicrobiia bacterium]